MTLSPLPHHLLVDGSLLDIRDAVALSLQFHHDYPGAHAAVVRVGGRVALSARSPDADLGPGGGFDQLLAWSRRGRPNSGRCERSGLRPGSRRELLLISSLTTPLVPIREDDLVLCRAIRRFLGDGPLTLLDWMQTDGVDVVSLVGLIDRTGAWTAPRIDNDGHDDDCAWW